MDREQKFAKNTLILTIGNFLPKAVTFIMFPILTKNLTKTDYGTYDLIIVLSSLLLPSATLQIQAAAFRFLLGIKGNVEKKVIITNAMIFVVSVSLVVLIFIYFFWPDKFCDIQKSVCVYLFVDNLYLCIGQIARGLSKNFEYAVCSIFVAINKVIFTIGFVQRLQSGLTGAIMALTYSYAFSIIMIIYKVRLAKYFDIKCIKISVIKSMLHYSWPMVPNNISMWIMRVSDRFLISIFMGTASNAVYAVANKIPSILTIAQSTFSMAWTESASVTVDDVDVDNYYSRMFEIIQKILAGLTALILACMPFMFKLLVRGDYDDAYFHTSILIVAMYYSGIAIYIGGIYIANMRTRSVGMTTVMAAALNFMINVLFIHKIGLYAASISTAVSYFVLMLYRLFNVQRFQKIKIKYSELLFINLTLVGLAVLCAQRSFFSIVLCFIFGIIFAFYLNIKLICSVFQIFIHKRR